MRVGVFGVYIGNGGILGIEKIGAFESRHIIETHRGGKDRAFFAGDAEPEEWRAFKQLIERLNRTYKYHVRPAAGFNSNNGAVALTTLFVTNYNFLRPHMSLLYKTPIHLPELATISTIQGKWAKIISLAA